jgi:hypothetical protein
MQKIHFKDSGQELLWVVIDIEGVITDCNAQKSIWVGLKVYKERLRVGGWVWINRKHYLFEIVKIEAW